MEYKNIALYVLIIFLFLLLFVWGRQYGFKRAFVAIIFRGLWVSPLVLMLFPTAEEKKIFRSFDTRSVHVLVDDSSSMKALKTSEGKSFWSYIPSILDGIYAECERKGCMVKVRYLSEITEEVKTTKLNEALASWAVDLNSDQWVLITDGGDHRPEVAWSRFWTEWVIDEELFMHLRKKVMKIFGSSRQEIRTFLLRENRLELMGL